MARYFKDASDKSKACLNTVEKQINGMHRILTQHSEES